MNRGLRALSARAAAYTSLCCHPQVKDITAETFACDNLSHVGATFGEHSQTLGTALGGRTPSYESAIMSRESRKRVFNAGEDALAFDGQSQPAESLKPAHLSKRKQRNKALEVIFNPQEHRY
jgi:hypothetical protein